MKRLVCIVFSLFSFSSSSSVLDSAIGPSDPSHGRGSMMDPAGDAVRDVPRAPAATIARINF